MGDFFDYEGEEEKEREIQRRVQQEIEKRFEDPIELRKMLQQSMDQLITEKEKNRQLQPKVEKYEQFLDADGYISIADVSSILQIPYITPSGKTKKMGRNKLCLLLEHDGIMYKNGKDYSFKKEFSDRGYGRTYVSEKNGLTVTSVHFTPKGIDWLLEKYSKDDRIFRSSGQGDIHVYRKE